ncbi:MAG: NAD(P)-binding domain-containing protein [Gammaproteobacteria bacterium]|nr:NAD(P)-binding domain-containing protein [Gammaproteobacteria bacterium]
MARVGFIGTGEIASAMVHGIAVHGLAEQGYQIFVSERNAERAAQLAERYPEVSVLRNQAVLDHSDVVCLCLLKDVAEAVLPSLQFRAEQQIISAMVDVDLPTLKHLCAPASDISITIPLPFIANGGCPLPVFPDTGSVAALFGERNLILPMTSQRALNAHFAATAMASGMFAQMQTVSEWLGGITDDPAAAEAYVVAMLGGYVSSLPTDGQARLLEALQSLNTEGGLNATLRQHLQDAGVLESLSKGLDNFKPRLGLS